MQKLAATSKNTDNDTRTAFVSHAWLVFEKTLDIMKHVNFSFYYNTSTVTILCIIQTNFHEHDREQS